MSESHCHGLSPREQVEGRSDTDSVRRCSFFMSVLLDAVSTLVVLSTERATAVGWPKRCKEFFVLYTHLRAKERSARLGVDGIEETTKGLDRRRL